MAGKKGRRSPPHGGHDLVLEALKEGKYKNEDCGSQGMLMLLGLMEERKHNAILPYAVLP